MDASPLTTAPIIGGESQNNLHLQDLVKRAVDSYLNDTVNGADNQIIKDVKGKVILSDPVDDAAIDKAQGINTKGNIDSATDNGNSDIINFEHMNGAAVDDVSEVNADDNCDSAACGTDGAETADIIKMNKLVVQLWCLSAKICDKSVSCFIDSGSQATVLKTSVFNKISENERPKLRKYSGQLVGVDGGNCSVAGVARLPFMIQDQVYYTDTIVADIQPDCLIGLNFLIDHNAVPDFANGTMRLKEMTVLLTHKPSNKSCRLALVNKVTIAAKSEAVVMLTSKKKVNLPEAAMVTPLRRFSYNTGVYLGRSLASPNEHNQVPAVIVNPSDVPVLLAKGYSMALAQPATVMLDNLNETTPIKDSDLEQNELPPLVEELLNRTELDGAQKCQLRALLSKHQAVFAGPDKLLGRTDLIEHHINTGDEMPIKLRSRRLPQAQHDMAKVEIDKMLEKGVITESDSPWAAPIVLVSKKDGSLRFCVDYRRLNDITKKDSYPLPNIEDTFDALAGANYFCALDLASGYWQVPLDAESREKTAFTTKFGLYQFNVMPFGLCNAPATFERLMERILRGHLGQRCLVYIDDVVVYGSSFSETLHNLDIILESIGGAGLQLKPQKCELFKSEILYLGFRISGRGISPDPKKVDSVKNWPVPCNVSDVRTFLGFANYHRRFIKDFAAIANPLTGLTKKNVVYTWGEDQQRAFDALKEALITAPVLNHPQRNAPFILDTDASAYALGGVLSQVVDGQERVIGYASQTLSKSQRNYCTTHRELLAVVQMTKTFKHFLWGRHFLIRTDHSSLRWLMNYRDADGMVSRWLTKLQEFDFVIEHRPGLKHLNADGLSRCHSCKNPDCPGFMKHLDVEKKNRQKKTKTPIQSCAPKGLETNTTEIPELMRMPVLTAPQYTQALKLDLQIEKSQWLQEKSLEDIAAAQQVDRHVGPVYRWVQDNFKPDKLQLATHSDETKALVSRLCALSIENGVLVRHGLTSRVGEEIKQIILPTAFREDVLHNLHDLRVSGHLGIQRTIARVQRKFYWPGLSLDVARWCASCPECAGRKGKPGPGRVPLTSIPTGAPFERIAMDILDTRKRTSRGFQYILVISDYFSKYTDAFPLRRHTAPVVADILMRRWIVYHGVPRQIHTDQGTEFESTLMQTLARLLGFEKTRTSPYRPQSDGQVERFNRSLLNMLSAFVTDQALDWDEHLPYVCMAYRSSINTSTGCSPYSMVFGREYTMPIDLMYPDPDFQKKNPQCGPEYVSYIKRALETAHSFAREHLRVAAQRQKRNYDVHAKERNGFAVGDLVRYYYPPAKQTNKFARPWLGPFTVLDKPTMVDYKISLVSDPSKIRTVHLDTIKPYEKPYSSSEMYDFPGPIYDAPPEVLEDHPDHIDEMVTDGNPEVPESGHPDSLQPSLAQSRARRIIRPPNRYGFDEETNKSSRINVDLTRSCAEMVAPLMVISCNPFLGNTRNIPLAIS